MMACVSDGDNYEKVLIFGGISNNVETKRSGKKNVVSALSS